MTRSSHPSSPRSRAGHRRSLGDRGMAAAALTTLVLASLSPCAASAQHLGAPAASPAAAPPRPLSAGRSSGGTNVPTGVSPDTGAAARPDTGAGSAGFGGDPIDAATREYRAHGIARAVTEGQVVVVPYGHVEPVLACTVLRACVIELEAGETVVSDPIAGDQVRWLIAGAKSGPAGATTLVVVKPKDCDITTNLVIPTDRRIYDLTLDSPPCKGATSNPQQPFVRHVRFYYPDDEASRLMAGVTASWSPGSQRRQGELGVAPERLNFDYRVKKDRKFPWAPAQVFDDGARVFIKLPPEAAQSVAPVLFAVEDDGARTIVNYAVRGDLYVADRPFHRGVLVIGDGRTERRVEIENRAFGPARLDGGR